MAAHGYQPWGAIAPLNGAAKVVVGHFFQDMNRLPDLIRHFHHTRFVRIERRFGDNRRA
ncbi:MAG: hypothetical protein IPL28_06340 [Chloroflexi bacterium]|nr:hypothetical protein [Chloroflexota bacterium]